MKNKNYKKSTRTFYTKTFKVKARLKDNVVNVKQGKTSELMQSCIKNSGGETGGCKFMCALRKHHNGIKIRKLQTYGFITLN